LYDDLTTIRSSTVREIAFDMVGVSNALNPALHGSCREPLQPFSHQEIPILGYSRKGVFLRGKPELLMQRAAYIIIKR
jgi:hypothetical protein